MKNITTELTRECDRHLLAEWKRLWEMGMHTYLCRRDGEEGRFYMRFPGATRGVVEFTADGTITNVTLYGETATGGVLACYEPGVRDAAAAFIGRNVYEGGEGDG